MYAAQITKCFPMLPQLCNETSLFNKIWKYLPNHFRKLVKNSTNQISSLTAHCYKIEGIVATLYLKCRFVHNLQRFYMVKLFRKYILGWMLTFSKFYYIRKYILISFADLCNKSIVLYVNRSRPNTFWKKMITSY